MSWKSKLSRDVVLKDGKRFSTLGDARAYALKLGPSAGRQHWQHAIKLLLEAGEGGNVNAATDQVVLALFLDAKLDTVKTPVE